MLINSGIKSYVKIINIIIDGLCKDGKVEAASEFFNGMSSYGLVPNTISHTVSSSMALVNKD